MFTRDIHWPLSCATIIQPYSLSNKLILPPHLRLGLTGDHFPSGCPTKTLYGTKQVFMLCNVFSSSAFGSVVTGVDTVRRCCGITFSPSIEAEANLNII